MAGFRALKQPAARIALAYLAVGAFWVLAADSLLGLILGEPVHTAPDPLAYPQGALYHSVKGLTLVIASALLLFWISRRQHRFAHDPRTVTIRTPSGWIPVATFLLFALGLVFTGFTVFDSQRAQLHASARAQLQSVGELRTREIVHWLANTRANARYFGHDSLLSDFFERWLLDGARDAGLERRMRHRIQEIAEAYGYTNISLFDSAGNIRLSLREDPHMLEHQGEARTAMARGRSVLVDYHHHGGVSDEAMLGMVAPMTALHGDESRVVGAMFFAIPAASSMVPMFRHWPTPSASGETLLTRPEGDGVHVLLAPRDASPKLELGPLLQTPTAQALAARKLGGEKGFLTGAANGDGEGLLAFAVPIADSPWILVAQQDQAEVNAQADSLARLTAVVTGLLLLAAGAAFSLWWRSQSNRQRAQLLGKELERQTLARRYETLSRFASDVILIADQDGRILEVNERLETLYGFSREEVSGQPLSMLLPMADQQAFARTWSEILAGQTGFEGVHQRRDGSRFPVEISAHTIELQGERHVHLTLRDISLRKAAEQQLRLQALVLDQIQDQVTVTDLGGVITYVNDSACRGSGYPAARLVGRHVGVYGSDPHPDQPDIIRATLEQGRWTGTLAHRRADGEIRQVELRTSLVRDEDGQPVRLVGVASDITERLRAQAALRDREALYRGVIETSADGFWVVDTGGRILEVNDAYCQLSGYQRQELLGMAVQDLDVQENPDAVARHVSTIMARGSDLFETRHRAKDGTVWQVEVNTSYTPLNGGRMFVFLRDLQRRNRSEALLRARLRLSDLALKSDLDQLMQAALDTTELFTGSQIGFFHFVDPDQETLTLQAWSSNTLAHMCTAEGKGLHYPVSQAGVWVDAVIQRRPVIHNDYASLPHRKGMPEGHAPVVRELVVPILRENKVVAVLGVGNKVTGYTQDDIDVAEQLASMVMDMVARKRAEGALVETNRRLNEARRLAQLGDWSIDMVSQHITWSREIFDLVGRDPDLPAPPLEEHRRFIHPDDYPAVQEWARRAIEQGQPVEGELRLLRPDGSLRHGWLKGQTERDGAGHVVRVHGTLQDISERREAEARLEQATQFDALTGLANTRRLLENLDRAIATAPGQPRALLVLNLDRFAQLNESLGRAAGDQVLVTLARRWAASLPPDGLLARLGADAFAVVQDDFDDAKRVIETAARLMDDARIPIACRSNGEGEGTDAPVSLTLSIGIALSPNDAGDATALLHAAEDALRTAKTEKGNQARFFDRRHAQSTIEWFETERALRSALDRQEFFLVFQPQADAQTGRPVAAEALLRWRRDGQVMAPARFIHIVENTDLAEPVSRWVLETACRQARQWLDRHHPLRVAVNIFSSHVTGGRLVDDVRQALALTDLPAQLLELEVLESSLLKDPENASQVLREVKRLGVGLALDDFGTGYSSLGYLKHYPFDLLKIDQLFARNVNRDPEDAAIVRSTIALAHSLGMRILAEGVETEPQLRFMARYGCDQIQGYLLGRPASAEELQQLLADRRDLRPEGPEQTQERKGILVVEDEPVEAERLRMVLEDENYAVTQAEDLEGVLDVMGRERIDLILCDHYLRDTTGLDILEQIRRLFPDVPRVMNSGTQDQAVVVEAINRAGVSAFLSKPVQTEALLATLRRLLNPL